MKYWRHWENLQRMPDGPLPWGATPYRTDTDQAYSITREGENWIYGDGSNRPREWVENLLAWPSGEFGAFYSYDNVSRAIYDEVDSAIDYDLPTRLFGHSRAVFVLPLACKLHDLGYQIEEVVLYGVPKPGGRKFVRECEKRGIKITYIDIRRDWVTGRPLYGKRPEGSKQIRLDPVAPAWAIRRNHLAYGLRLKEADL